MKRQERVEVDRFVIGGLHTDDFEPVRRQYEEDGYVLVAFVLECDGYHWRAVYVKADMLDSVLGGDFS